MKPDDEYAKEYALAAWLRENMIQAAVWTSRSELFMSKPQVLVTE